MIVVETYFFLQHRAKKKYKKISPAPSNAIAGRVGRIPLGGVCTRMLGSGGWEQRDSEISNVRPEEATTVPMAMLLSLSRVEGSLNSVFAIFSQHSHEISSRQINGNPIVERANIEYLLKQERYYRDTRQWDKLRASYHADDTKTFVNISWYVWNYLRRMVLRT